MYKKDNRKTQQIMNDIYSVYTNDEHEENTIHPYNSND